MAYALCLARRIQILLELFGMVVDKLVSDIAIKNWDWCIELCGGTHVDRAGEIKGAYRA